MSRSVCMVAIATLLIASPVAAADGDKLLACYVGNGVVEMRNGASAQDALSAVFDDCFATALDPVPEPEPEGEWGDYVDYVSQIALSSLKAIEAADALN